jgi:hypothetical protein
VNTILTIFVWKKLESFQMTSTVGDIVAADSSHLINASTQGNKISARHLIAVAGSAQLLGQMYDKLTTGQSMER